MKSSKSEVVTRNEFDINNNVIARSFERIMKEIGSEFKAVRAESKAEFKSVRAEFKLVREDISSLKDNFAEVMFELKEIREDLAASTYRRREISDTLDSHNSRITVVEKKLLV